MTPESFEIRCTQCGAVNRVPAQPVKGKRVICGRCKEALGAESAPGQVTDANFAETVAASPLPVLLDLWAPWCGPCRMVAPILEQLAREWAGRIRIGKLNVDENPRTAARFGVQSIPTLLILRQGQEIERMVGALPKEAIAQRLDTLLRAS